MVFADPASRALLDYLERMAPSDVPILINGETGTGKELVARHVHRLSHRTGPFLAVNCGAITEQLAESELFGHEAGSFTGAAGRREGWFEAADGGTLFLDEIGDLPLPLQVKLLRVLQEREVVRLGSRRPIPVNVRLVAATNVDLNHAVQAGRFRLDLLFRLNIAQIRVPPLRERPGDIEPLAQHFLSQYAQRLGRTTARLSASALAMLLRYPWPGNIRELENAIHFALLVADGSDLQPEHLKMAGNWNEHAWDSTWSVGDEALGTMPGAGLAGGPSPLAVIGEQLERLFDDPPADLFNQLDLLIVSTAFRASGENQVRAAALLGVTRNVVRTMLRRHGFVGAGDSSPPASDDAGFTQGAPARYGSSPSV
ncbi:sigma-54 interaction domain-containing protein [Paraburkholderia lycopersici]|nr:sigma-54 dependent transcriptional regulator [Paraburkholderia lycopersici]